MHDHSPTMLMAHRGRAPDDEAEPVVIDHDGDIVVLRLDDGDELRFDRRELSAAVDDDELHTRRRARRTTDDGAHREAA